MRQVSVLGGGEIAPEMIAVLQPATVSVMEAAMPANVGPRSRAILESVEPIGHFGITGNGAFTLVHSGQTWDSFDAGKEESLRKEIELGHPLVIFGCGAGNLLFRVRTICQSVRDGVPPIIIYEPNAGVLKAFLSVRFPLQGVSVCCDIDDFRHMLQTLLQGQSSLTIFHTGDYVMPAEIAEQRGPIAVANQEAYALFSDVVRRIVDAEQVTMNTIAARMGEWIRNVAENLDACAGQVPAMSLAGAFVGAPAFIVGAGPSLDRNGPLLASCYEKGLVITVDVAARAFVKHNAQPHLFLAVEGRDLSEHLEGVEWIDTVPRAFSLEASPAVLKIGNGPLLPWADSNFSFNAVNHQLLGSEGLPIGGSVTTAAFLFAEAFGCNPIILVGQDLANTGGKRAADGVLADKLHALEEHGEVAAWGDPATKIPDTPQWLHARVWFEQRAARLAKDKPHIRLINCTEGGSHVDGFEDLPLADVIEEMQSVSIDIKGALNDVQPVWKDGIDWFRDKQVEKLQPIADAAFATVAACEAVASMIRTDKDADVSELMATRTENENAFRVLAAPHEMFTGWTQALIINLQDIRKQSTKHEMVGEDAAAFFDTEAGIFRAMGDAAVELRNVLTRQTEKANA